MRAAWRACAAPLLVLLALAATAERPSECASWARSGECQSNPAFMQLHCAAECEAAEVVVDPFGELEQCAGWAEQGECTRNPKFMLASCPKNCAKQRASVHEVLVDELITCIDDADEQSCSSNERVRRSCIGACATISLCHNEPDPAECTRALRCRELKDEQESCAHHVQTQGCTPHALKNCYLSCARHDLPGLMQKYRSKFTVRTRKYGLLDDDRSPLGFLNGLSAERAQDLPRSAAGPPLPCWKGTAFDVPPAATCESERVHVLQRWRKAAEPRCRALQHTTPRASPRRLLATAAAPAVDEDQDANKAHAMRLGESLSLPDGLEISLVPVLASPKVRLVEGFLTASEAQHIIALGMPKMHRSLAGARQESIRTSTTAMLPGSDPVVEAITKRASVLTGYPVEYIEPLQLLKYTAGQKYEPHFDYGEACDYEENLMNGHRHVTMLVYLNSVPEEYDGRTHFPKLGVTIAPTAYNALVFNDCLPNGQEDPRTLHGGAPPAAGYTEAKIAINIWIRAAPWVRRDQRITAAA